LAGVGGVLADRLPAGNFDQESAHPGEAPEEKSRANQEGPSADPIARVPHIQAFVLHLYAENEFGAS